MKKLYIARDKDGNLFLFNNKPQRIEGEYMGIWDRGFNCLPNDVMEIDDEWFPSVTWENSPQEVELKLINNGNQN